MKKHISFGKIKHTNGILYDIKHKAQFVGLDENENPIYDKSLELPKIKAFLTEKVHGTNCSVHYNEDEGLWVQSKNNIITTEKDNAGCAFLIEQEKEKWVDFIEKVAKYHNIDLDDNTISIFFELAGGNILQNTCVSGLDKMFFIFEHFKVTDNETEEAYWIEFKKGVLAYNTPENTYFITNYPTWEVEIDFNNFQASKNKLAELVDKIENNSPIGVCFGKFNNIAEGLVGTFWYRETLYRFKVKGEKHSKGTKVKKLRKKEVNEELENLKIELANIVTPSWRLEQMFDLANDTINGGFPRRENLGTFTKMVNQDILEEEVRTLKEFGLTLKDIQKKVAQIAKTYFLEQL